MGRRSRWLALTLALCFVVVLALLVNIQLRRATVLSATATNPRNAVERFDNARGLVLAADGSVLARSVPTGANRHMPRRPAVRERRSMRPRLGAECSP